MAISNSASGFRPGVCTSTTRPTAPYEGQMIYETDTNRVLVWDNAVWVMIADTDTPPGMQLITTQSFTNSNRIDFLNVFSSDFISYRVVFHYLTSNSNDEVYMQLRSSGGLITASDYLTTRIEATGGGSINSFYSAGGYVAQWRPTYCETGGNNQVNGHFDIFRPNEAVVTNFAGQFHRLGNVQYVVQSGGYFRQTTQLTGFSIGLGTSQTFTGNISVYGYRN